MIALFVFAVFCILAFILSIVLYVIARLALPNWCAPLTVIVVSIVCASLMWWNAIAWLT